MMTLLLVFSLCFPVASFADTNDEIKLQMLNSQIEELTKERDKKYEELKQCEKTTNGFKIAGISTLVATGVGIYGNVKLHQKLTGKTGGGKGMPGDNRSKEQKANAACTMFCLEFPDEASQKGCSC